MASVRSNRLPLPPSIEIESDRHGSDEIHDQHDPIEKVEFIQNTYAPRTVLFPARIIYIVEAAVLGTNQLIRYAVTVPINGGWACGVRHWGSHAAMLQTRMLVEAIRPGLWKPDALRREGDRVRAAELPEKFMNLDIPQAYEVYRVERPGIEFQRSSFRVAPGSSWAVESVRARSERQVLIPGQTLVVHDSFMLRSRDAFSRFTEHVQYLRWEDFVSYPEESALLFRGADRVVFQLVQADRSYPCLTS